MRMIGVCTILFTPGKTLSCQKNYNVESMFLYRTHVNHNHLLRYWKVLSEYIIEREKIIY
jgi:hypothetical protein